MQISSKFTIAVHTLLLIELFGTKEKVTSAFIASSVCVHPVIIRTTLSRLKTAGFINVRRGTGGAVMQKEADAISLYDIYEASGSAEDIMFGFHEHPNPQCTVGRNIHTLLDRRLDDAQKAFENSLASTTLGDLKRELARTCQSAG